MVTVWVREDPRRCRHFHRSPRCRQLQKGPARGHPHELLEMDLDQVPYRPCRTCYPDAPRVDVRRQYCEKCESPYACAHNGGVLVITRAGHRRWLWPDTEQMPWYRREGRVLSTTTM